MILTCTASWTPGGTGVMPVALMEPREIECPVLGGYRYKSGTEFLEMSVDGGPAGVWWRFSPAGTFRVNFQSQEWWMHEARSMAEGETRRIKTRYVTRLTEDELKAFQPIPLGAGSY